MKGMNSTGKKQTAVKNGVTTNNKPLLSRFFRGLGIRYTVQLALVIILLLIVVVVTLNDTQKCATRDKAFQQIAAADKTDNFTGIIQGAEQFFSVKPLTRKDERESFIRELYDKAIVRLFTAQSDKLDAKALEHFQRYRHLIVDTRK